jgi:hypothetical protein
MVSLRRIVLAGAALCFGMAGLFAQAQNGDELAKQISGLPWKTDQVAVDNSSNQPNPIGTVGGSEIAPAVKSQIVLSAHYVNPDVVADTDTGYVGFYPQWILDKDGKRVYFGIGSGRGCSRDGQDRWCGGVGEFQKVSKDGFDYHLNLTWQIDGQSEKKFDETFHCR